MTIISLDAARPGMVLAEDLLGPDGALLASKKTELSASLLRKAGDAGVTTCDVKDVNASGGDELDPALLEQAEKDVDAAFAFTDPAVPAVRAIRDLAVRHIALSAAQGKAPPAPRRLDARPASGEDLFPKSECRPADLVRHEVTLASFPDIYFNIREAVDSPMSSPGEIAGVVSKDTSLSAKLLKLVNSPFYGFPQKIDSIARAVMVVGGDEISTLALGVSAINAFTDIPEELMNMRDFWEHSITCGVYAKTLGDMAGGLHAERLFTAGMLHDIGRLILFNKLPRASVEAMTLSLANRIPPTEAEKEVFGFTHAEVGAELMRAWKFPEELALVVERHHTPLDCPNTAEAAIVHAGDVIAVATGRAPGGGRIVPSLSREEWNAVGLSGEAVPAAAQIAEKQIGTIVNAFIGA